MATVERTCVADHDQSVVGCSSDDDDSATGGLVESVDHSSFRVVVQTKARAELGGHSIGRFPDSVATRKHLVHHQS